MAASLAADVARITGDRVVGAQRIGGGDICRAYRMELAAGATVFVKRAPPGAEGMLRTEAAGLAWLDAAGAPVPDVLGQRADILVLSWHDAHRPDAPTAQQLGRDLARLHACGAPGFGSPPPGADAVGGFIGSARMSFADSGDWPTFFAEHRITPYLAGARACGHLTTAQYDTISRLCEAVPRLAGPHVAPARLHGDLWSGNILWTRARALLIDPAAYGGHPESDLAMLALFGCPHFADMIVGYEQVTRLAPGWRDRIHLHQVYPLLVHAQLFGGGYGAAAASAASAALRSG